MSFTRRPSPKHPRQTSRRVDRPIVRNSEMKSTASSAAIQTQVVPSLGALCILEPCKCAWLMDNWDRGAHNVCCPLRPRLEWCRARGNWTAVEWNQVVLSYESRFNLSSNDNRIRVWRSCGARLNPAFDLQRHTAPTAVVMI
ncbi:transposable element Tcb2 transposase [Trichonephila clavipes]|nr:transposable element Tcb2 transposase [Trichonephila clavipes]